MDGHRRGAGQSVGQHALRGYGATGGRHCDDAARQGHRARRKDQRVNTPTLVTSLVMAALLVLVIAVLIQAMLRGWRRRRAQRQVQIVGMLPSLPDTVGPAIVPATKGLYESDCHPARRRSRLPHR